ncbi:hypothetical protein QUW15_06515 [Desulfovibrio piger]|nr:hypothetical protein [Desulfovibrio piger]
MSELVPHEHLVAVEDVLRRWHIEPWRLDEIMRSAKIPLFSIANSRINPSNGAIVHFCNGPFSSIHSPCEGCYEYEDLFIPLEDVTAYEKAHPEVLWEPVVTKQTLKRESQALTDEYGEYIPADVIRKKMRMSPMQFIDLMNSGKGPVCAWEEDFREHNPINGPYFKTGDLASEFFTVNVLDWLAWQKARGGGSECIPSDAALAAKNAELEQARAELAALKAELEQSRAEMSALREENAALNEELERARQEKGQGDAPEWYGLIAVVEQCRKEGKKPQETAAELKKAGASLAVIGGLLHPNGGISDWRQYGKNLLEGGTKYLPW